MDNLIAQKQQKTFTTPHDQLVELLLQKDSELKANLKVYEFYPLFSSLLSPNQCIVTLLKLAEEQGTLQQKVVALETEVERHDVEIRNLQKQLKEAEQLLVSILMINQSIFIAISTIHLLIVFLF